MQGSNYASLVPIMALLSTEEWRCPDRTLGMCVQVVFDKFSYAIILIIVEHYILQQYSQIIATGALPNNLTVNMTDTSMTPGVFEEAWRTRLRAVIF